MVIFSEQETRIINVEKNVNYLIMQSLQVSILKPIITVH